MSRFIAISNRKGGTGKTTTAVNLAAALGKTGRKVLVVDLDPQYNASDWLGWDDVKSQDMIDVLIKGKSPSSVARETYAKNVDLLCSSARMNSAENLLRAEQIGNKKKLKMAFADEPEDRWDVVLLDCPADVNLLTFNALFMAEEIIVPVEASDMAVSGMAQLLTVFMQIRKAGENPRLKVAGFLPTAVDVRNNHDKSVVRSLRRQFEELTLETIIPKRTSFKDAFREQASILDYEPESDAAEAFRALAEEVLQMHSTPATKEKINEATGQEVASAK